MNDGMLMEWMADGSRMETGVATFHFNVGSFSVRLENFKAAYELNACIQRERSAIAKKSAATALKRVTQAIKDLEAPIV